MKTKLLLLFLVSLPFAGFSQDWAKLDTSQISANDKALAVNDQGFVLRFFTENVGNNGFVHIWNPNTEQWSNITGPFSGVPLFDVDVETDGQDFYISCMNNYTPSVYQVSPIGSVTDISAGMTQYSLNEPSDLFISKTSNELYLAGVTDYGDDIIVLKYSGSSWDTLDYSPIWNIGPYTPSSINSISGYVTPTDVFLGITIFNGGAKSTQDDALLLRSDPATGPFLHPSGIGGPLPFHADRISIDGDGTETPWIITNNAVAYDSVHVYKYTGGGLGNVQGMQFSFDISNVQISRTHGQPQILISTYGGVENTDIFVYNGAQFENVHPSQLGLGQIDDDYPEFAQHPVNGNPYVITEFVSDSVAVFALNDLPYIDSYQVHDVCPSGGTFLENLAIRDMDRDSVWIIGTSSNQTIVSDFDIYVYHNFYSPDSTLSYFDIDFGFAQTGTCDIYLDIYDGISHQRDTIPVTILSDPILDETGINNLSVCDNQGPINLDGLVLPTGGTYSGPAINGNFLDAQIAQAIGVIYYDYTDGNGCSVSSEITLNTFNAPSLSLGAGITAANCGTADGAAEVTVTAGSSNDYYFYWSTGATTTLINNIASGQYVANVIDTNDCQVSLPVVVPSLAITITENNTAPTCHNSSNGAIDLTLSGSGPFEYYWITGDTTEDLTNLSVGFYSVMITDNNGCSTSHLVNLEPATPSLYLDAVVNDGNCGSNNGGVTINQVIGGSGSFSFLWSNAQTTQSLTNVAPGIYSVTVTDGACTYMEEFTVSTFDGPYISTESVTNVDCNQNNGAIDISIYSGANNVQSILWSNSSATEDLTGLSAGTYNVVVTDVTGCETYSSFLIEGVKPAQQPICVVTVDSTTTTNLLVWERVQATGISHYNIYRETGAIDNYTLVGTVNATDESIWNDVNASPVVTSWRYKLSSVDDCGVESDLSAHHKTIHVTINKGTGTNYNVFWDDYEGINYSTVNLYRYDAVNGAIVLATLPSNIYSYTDNPGTDTLGLDYFVGFDLVSPCTSSRAQDYNGTRSNRSAGIFDPGNGVNLSIEEYEDINDQFVVYPNPNNGVFTIDFSLMNGSKQIKLIDSRGRIVAYKTTSQNTYNLTMNHLESGMYFVEVIYNNQKGIKKIIIQ
ncbi:MAG: T9SS type A sorting domain-containing protein [Crocinitomicaceae bacterium]